jgi:membrane-bound lytic murein transglycosylase MltF
MYDRRWTKESENICNVFVDKYGCLTKTRDTLWFARLFIIALFPLVVTMLAGFPVRFAAAEESAPPKYTIREANRVDFDEMVKHREIRVLVANSKTFYCIDRGKQMGITHDWMKAFEEFVNKKTQAKTLKTHIVFIPVARDKLIPGLLKGYGDIAASNLTITPERLKSVDFSEPLLSGVKEVLITGPASLPINNLDDKKTGKEAVELTLADENLEDEDLLEMLNAGLIPMIIVDNHKAQFWQKIFPSIKIHADIALRTGGEIAWAFRKNSPKLKTVINEFVKANRKGTLTGNLLFTKYLQNINYVKNAVSEKELKKFNDTVEIFERYAGEYNFDYLMITAQAYQESMLDNSRKSKAGAVGIMQVLPSTAADPNVNIRDIEKLENNIQAGIKYLRFIFDQYYKDEPMSEANKLLFSFAAYNAGPGNVIKIRQKTAEMGLDPNVWFYNAEIAAAKIIGRETVQYVSNIYKYYVAYALIREREDQKKRGRGNRARKNPNKALP